MRATMQNLLWLASLAACVACGGTTVDNTTTDGGDGGSNGKDSSALGDATSGRVPKNHRATAVACPTGRGTENGQFGDSGVPGSCAQDSDCTSGTNGRCVPNMGGAFYLTCSYDQCATDGDCAGTACVCRPDATSVVANVCASSKSQCRLDSDCGAGGYCSPSESSDVFCFSPDLDYFCHTPADECIDDTDCANGGCNYDPSVKHWKCGSLCAPPPP
jgi:hypothetical protein